MIREGTRQIGEGEEPTPLTVASEPGGQLIIQAKPENEGTVRIGGVSVTSEEGIALAKGEILPPFCIDDLSTVFIAGDKPGDGVAYIVSGRA